MGSEIKPRFLTNLVPLDLASVEALLGQLAQRQEPFKHCPELQAASLEILNLLASLGFHKQVASVVPSEDGQEQSSTPSALLTLHTGLKLVYDVAASNDGMPSLLPHFQKMLSSDTNTACRMLEVVPGAWELAGRTDPSGLCELYLGLCDIPSAPEVRAQALRNLGPVMDHLLCRGEIEKLPGVERLDKLWESLQDGDINPTLSCAIIETSGTIMAALVSRDTTNIPNMEQRLRSWGDMLYDCLDVDNVSSPLPTPRNLTTDSTTPRPSTPDTPPPRP